MKDLCDYMDSNAGERLEDLWDETDNFDVDEDEQLEEEYESYGISADPDPFEGWVVDDDLLGEFDETVEEEE